MKKVLITGAKSFVGSSFDEYLKRWPERYQVDTISLKGDDWKKYSFTEYDTVYHVAGIAHVDVGKVSDEHKALFYKVNTDLTIETAKKAKADGVKQFIFMSSAIVYGDPSSIGKKMVITEKTPVSPNNHYSDSKIQAENGILSLEDDSYKVCILRPPMIYGKGSKGNYPTLAKMALKLPIFPNIKNSRSMCYIGNFVEFVRLMVDNEERGIFWPQNPEWSNTSQMVKMIAAVHDKKMILAKGFGWAFKLMSLFSRLVNKAFGNLAYDLYISEYKEPYQRYTLEQSIKDTEQ